MGKFKDEHGKSRLKSWIDKALKIGAKIPDEVLMLVEFAVPAISAIRDAINKVRESKELDQSMKMELIDILEAWEIEISNVTERHRIDTGSESWLSKNVRPIMLVVATLWMMFMDFVSSYYTKVNWTAIQKGEGAWISFDDPSKERWWGLLAIGWGFYFGGRSVMHIVDRFKGVKVK